MSETTRPAETRPTGGAAIEADGHPTESLGPPRVAGPTVLFTMIVLVTLIVVTLCVPVAYSAWTEKRPPVDTFEIVAEYPHDGNAFTQGLIFVDLGGEVGEALYESTGLKKRSTLRRVELETGRVVKSVRVPGQYFAEGLTLIGRRLYQLTYRSGVGFIYDAESFRKLGEFPLPTDERTNRPIEGWGLTTDGESLIVSDGSHKIRFLNLETFAVEKTIKVMDNRRPILRLNELEFVSQEIWANTFKTDTIVRISPKTGAVLGYIDLEGLKPADVPFTDEDVLNGIAFDRRRQRIFVTGKLWPKLFEIRVVPRQTR